MQSCLTSDNGVCGFAALLCPLLPIGITQTNYIQPEKTFFSGYFFERIKMHKIRTKKLLISPPL